MKVSKVFLLISNVLWTLSLSEDSEQYTDLVKFSLNLAMEERLDSCPQDFGWTWLFVDCRLYEQAICGTLYIFKNNRVEVAWESGCLSHALSFRQTLKVCFCYQSPNSEKEPRSESKESIPAAYVAWLAGSNNPICRTGPPAESIPVSAFFGNALLFFLSKCNYIYWLIAVETILTCPN
jgi:hypothetical protein